MITFNPLLFPGIPEKFCLHCNRFDVLFKLCPVQSITTSVSTLFCLFGPTFSHHLRLLHNGMRISSLRALLVEFPEARGKSPTITKLVSTLTQKWND